MSLYNIKRFDDHFIITKFDDDFNVESSYEFHIDKVGVYVCHCPAGQRPSCRHRQMFPMLQTRVDSPWFLDFDTRQWVDPTGAASEANSNDLATPIQKLHEPEPQQAVREPEGYEDRIAPTAQDSHPFRRRM